MRLKLDNKVKQNIGNILMIIGIIGIIFFGTIGIIF